MNPRAATNDLLPFQGSPFGQLGYFSKMPAYYTRYTFLTHSSFVVICLNLLSCACAPSRKTKGSPFNSELPKRRGWDSNPRALSDKRFSRPPRYDHFDTSPNFLSFHRLNCLVRPRDNVYSSIILSEMSTPFFHFFYFFVRWPLPLVTLYPQILLHCFQSHFHPIQHADEFVSFIDHLMFGNRSQIVLNVFTFICIYLFCLFPKQKNTPD